jgi:hypothetical protein
LGILLQRKSASHPQKLPESTRAAASDHAPAAATVVSSGAPRAALELPTDWALEWLSRPAKLWNVNCRGFVPLAARLGGGNTRENSHTNQNSRFTETLCPVNVPGKIWNLPVKSTAPGTRHSLLARILSHRTPHTAFALFGSARFGAALPFAGSVRLFVSGICATGRPTEYGRRDPIENKPLF